jgi:Spy/CpxP family protein refolding chaperone
MKNSRSQKYIATGALILSAAMFSLPAVSQQSHSSGNAGGGSAIGMGHMGGGHSGMMGKFKGLGLSDEQKAKMSDIQYKLHKRHWELMGPMIDQQQALKKARAGDRPDPAAVGAVYGKIFDLKRQMIEARIAAKNSSMDVLTDEQAAKMKEMKKMQGHGGMGHGGMKHGQSGQTN